MTPIKMFLTLSTVSATLLLGGCTEEPKPADADDVKREAREFADALGSYSAEQKDQAVAEAQQALTELNQRVDGLKARIAERWGEMDESARQSAGKNLETLEREQDQLADRFEALRGASGDAWARVSEGFSDAYAELREAWREADEAVAQ